MTTRMTSGNWAIQQNGAFGQTNRTPSGSVSSRSQVGGFHSSSRMGASGRGQSNKSSIVYDSTVAIKRKSALELGSGVLQSVGETSFIDLVQWIRGERLSSLPHQGSTWDTVLIRALYVAERLHKFETAIQGFAHGTNAGAELAYSHIRLLLERLGHENSDVLDKAFGLFYKSALTISSLLDRSELLSCTQEVQEQLCYMYTDLLTLVVEVAVYFYKTVQSMADGEVTLDLYEVFGELLDATANRRSHICNLIWSYQIESEIDTTEDALSIEVLTKWLAPQDRVLEMLGSDHTTFTDQLAERTGLWFQENLTNFVKGSNECLLLTGPAGSGKTTLSAAIAERLQRPVARQSLQTIYVSIGTVQAEATSLHVVKSILYQLLASRVGNLALYHSLVNAYHESRRTADPAAYEGHLWTALVEALQRPLEGANSSVIIVDGVDEVQGGQQAGQQLLEKLAKAVGRGKRTKLIAFAQSSSLPSGARGQTYNVTPEDTRDDIHTVAIRSLAHVPFFTKKSGPEQETIIASILDGAKGSFLWTILFSESLRPEKSAESFDKALQTLKSSPPSVTDLVSKLLTTLQPTSESRLLLSWLTVSARPLTIDEIACLFTVKPETGEVTATPANVDSILDSVLPLLSVKRDVVRPRHNLVNTTLQAVLQPLVDQGKIALPHKNRQVDFVLRTLGYAKNVLPKDGMPTLDNSDVSLPSRLFSKFPLLEYTVRYWTTHFGQTPFASTGSAAPKLPEEFKKAFPGSPTLPVLEWICWDDQYPGSQEVDLHTLVGRIRTDIFTQNHPAVMQSFINTAAYYVPMGNDREATKSYYYATTIGQHILSPSNPVTIECGNRFLTLSSQMTSTTRTEIMTQRETVLQVLITAYEKQFGATSELVVNTRQQLIDLYMHINEQENVSKWTQKQEEHVYRGNDFSRDGGSGAGLKNGLGASVRRRSDKELKTYEPGVFGPYDEEEDTSRTLDVAGAIALLKEAQSLHEQKSEDAAEEIYVDLWHQLSTICRDTLNTEFHELKLQTVNSYSKTLTALKRESEATSALLLVSEEYRHHELSHSEKVITQLTQSAETLETFEQHEAARSIYQQAYQYSKRTQKDSKSVNKYEELMQRTTNKVLNNTKTSKSIEEMQRLLKAALASQDSRVDATTVTRAQEQSKQYFESRQYEQAIEIITLTLQRTWSSFLSESTSTVADSSTLTKENLLLVERLAQTYIAQRKIEKAADLYLRLFRVAIASPKDRKDLLESTKTQLISIYDKYGYPDKSIGVLQDIVAVYDRVYGQTHDLTIATRYELGKRCRENARTHPYWIEYYQQIVSSLTKDSKEVTEASFEAATIVANTYWQERRSVDAVSTFSLLWNAFVKKTKSFKQFSDATFVQNLFDRYRQTLEATQADQQTIFQITEEFVATSKAQFGAESTVSKQALHSLTSVSETLTRTERKNEPKQLALLDQLMQQFAKDSTESRNLASQKTEIFRRRLTEQTNVSSEEINQARSLFQQEMNWSRSQYGFAHQSTLNSLREVTMLDFRQKKTEEAMKSINAAVSEISSSQEISQEEAMQSAHSIAQIFHASQQTQQSQELLRDLRSQIIAKEKRSNSSSSIDITQQTGKSALIFLASLEYHLRTDLSLTWSEIFADLQAERMYYVNFKKVTSGRSGLDKIVIAAAPLRFFLLKRGRKEQAQSLEQQIVALFDQRDLSGFSLEAKKTSPTIFILGILDFLGMKKRPDFVRAVIIATNRNLSQLIESNKFAEAYDVANVGFKYAQVHKGYEKPGAISMGFELASQLDGRGENKCPDETLRKKLLQLSNRIVKEILTICKDQEINLAQVHINELNELIALLGEQADYETLEWLLTTLWNTREAQRNWKPEALLNLGQRLVCSRYLAGHPVKAIRLCEDISYNLRRAHGISHPATLEAFQTLSQLYTSAGQYFQQSAANDKSAGIIAADYFKKAVIVEEDILRYLVSEGSGNQTDEDDTAAAILAEHGVQTSGPGDESDDHIVDRSAEVKTHLQLLKLAFQRYGQWPKNYGVYEQLNADVFAQYGAALKGAEGVEKWTAKGFGAGKAESNEGVFVAPAQWDIL